MAHPTSHWEESEYRAASWGWFGCLLQEIITYIGSTGEGTCHSFQQGRMLANGLLKILSCFRLSITRERWDPLGVEHWVNPWVMLCQKGKKHDGQTHWGQGRGEGRSAYGVMSAFSKFFHMWVTFVKEKRYSWCWMCYILSHLEFFLRFSDRNQSPSVKNNFQSLGVSSK